MTELCSAIPRVPLLLLLLALIPLVRGAYELRVMAHSYSNPSHQHARGGCCDNDYHCNDHCDNYFLFCLRPANYSHATWTCPLGVKHTGEVGGDSLTFGSQIGRQQNPMLFSNSRNWPGSFELLVAVNDIDSFFGFYKYFGEFIDVIYIEESLQPNGSFSTPQSYTGMYDKATISLSFQVACTENYYDSNCATFCEPSVNHTCGEDGNIVCRNSYYGTQCNVFCEGRNDSLGHYQCSRNGSKICLEGYQDPDTNCTTQLCEPECVAGRGYCNASGRCQCYSGWRGRHCNECIPNMECSTVGGYCMQPNECFCQEGYTGTWCEIVIDVCSQSDPCENGGSCSNDGAGGYSCLCPTQYTGLNCDTDINECDAATNPCMNGGQCFNEAGSFHCECAVAFTGSLCEEAIDIPPTASEGTQTVFERTPTASEGTLTASEGTPAASEGTLTASEGTPTASEGTSAGNTGSRSELPTTGTTTAVVNVGSSGQNASTSNLGLVLGVVFAVLLLLSLAFVVVVVLTVLLCRAREKGGAVLLLNEVSQRPRNLSLENPTYLPSTSGRHAVEPYSANSQQEYNLYNPLYSERDVDLSHYETADRNSRTSQMSEVIYSTIESGSREPPRIPSSSSRTPLVSNEGHYETINDYATEYMRMPPDDSSG